MVYGLLAGARLFGSETQVYRYFLGASTFPEDALKGLPASTEDVRNSLLKSMLAIKPRDRPTAAGALGNAWLTGLKSDDEDGGDDQDETTQRGDERTCDEESEGKLTTTEKPRGRGQGNPIPQDDSKCALGDVTLEANPRSQ